MDKIIEVRLDINNLEEAQDFMNKTFSSSPIQDRTVIFVVKDKEIINKDIRKLYDSLPIGVPFNVEVSDNIKIEVCLEANNKLYNNWIGFETFGGAMYFVEEKDIENVGDKG